MEDDMQEEAPAPPRSLVFEAPLFRLLAINFAAGVSLAVLLVGGLMLLNPGNIRDLILADNTPGIALGLLLFGFIITLSSSAMGTAIMAMGRRQPEGPPRGPGQFVAETAGDKTRSRQLHDRF
ncbi:hypothetical protein [Bradyrhizobium valentinum]|uniref:hypothetical protein n=1 Tax=Bradyrhizobium valentinum TaxID=1518501 RepID=UPI0007C7A59F|nr:hypothetical protein [Bradyrhizobium valentinum]